MAGLDKVIRKLFETDVFGYSVNEPNPNERSSTYDRHEPVGVGIGLGSGEAYYLDLAAFDEREKAVAAIRDILTNKMLAKAAYDAKSVNGSLRKLDIRPTGTTDDVMAPHICSIPAGQATRSNFSRKYI